MTRDGKIAYDGDMDLGFFVSSYYGTLSNLDLRNLNFSSVPMMRSSFKDCDFSGSDLYWCNMSNSVFEDCSFRNCEMQGVTLINSIFKNCDLSDSDLSPNNLARPSMLFGARFPNTRFDRSNLRECVIDQDTELPIGLDPVLRKMIVCSTEALKGASEMDILLFAMQQLRNNQSH